MNQSCEFFLQWNCRSLIDRVHWGEFKSYILHNKPLISAIQETRFLDSDASNYNHNIRNYSLYTNNINDHPRRGGAALYISNNLLHHQLSLHTPLNAVGAKVKIAQKDISVVSVYLSPTITISPNLISDLFSQLPPPVFIMGDFNAHHHSWGCTYDNTRGTQLFNILNKLDLIHINNLIPTHITTRNGQVSHSVIDLAITTPHIAPLFYQQVADDTLFSDHYPIHYMLTTSSGQANFNFIPRWNFKKADWLSFQQHIDSAITTSPPDINTFLNLILESARKNIPKTHPPRPNQRTTPWWNADCQRAVALRRRALRTFKRCICLKHELEVRKANTEARELILNAKIEGWNSFSSNFNRFTPLSKIWSMIKCFKNKNPSTYKIPHLRISNVNYLIPLEVATKFAEHYAAISSSQQYTHTLTTTLNRTLDTLSFHSTNTEQYNATFTSNELSLAIHKCRNTSPGPDQITYPFFKNLSESGFNTFLATLNNLWENNSFPTSWSSSTLIPILKSRKPPQDPASYRPISLTSCASKLLERMVNGRIRVYLETNKILSPHQNGFRPGRCTSDNIVQIIDSIQRGFQKDSYTIVTFLDFKNAFDKVNKAALLIKLHKTGIRGRTATFIKQFLMNRTFNVRCGNTYSPNFSQEHGLPQGSVLSPTLFLIMINDLFENNAPYIKYSMYADDVAFWTTHHDINIAQNNIQTALNYVNTWCEKWGLPISPTKSAAIVFSPPRLPCHNPPQLTINNQNIAYVTHYKYLGVTLDQKLKFNEHFLDIIQRCSRRINIMKCIAGQDWGADRRTLLQLYKTLIRPIIDYNGFLYDDISNDKIDSLQIIQNNALRIITGAFRTSPVVNLHIEVNLPTLDRRRKYQLLRFYARTSARKTEPTLSILNNKYSNQILTTAQRRFPVISYRIEKVLNHFAVQPFKVMSPPPLTFEWLYPPPEIQLLYEEPKRTITNIEAQQLFNQHKNKYKDYYYIYTDGSRKDGRAGAGIFSHNLEHSARLNDVHSVFTCELLAIVHAIDYLRDHHIKKAILCSDSLSSLQALATNKPSSHPITYLIRKALKEDLNYLKLIFLWVPSHTGIQGNEKADSLAKQSLTRSPRNDLPSPLSDI